MLRYRAFLCGALLMERLPRPLAYLLGMVLGELAFAINGAARRVAITHMRRVLGGRASPATIRRAARGCFRAGVWYYTDLARTPQLDPSRFNKHNIRDTGYEHLARAAASGRGVVLATIHYGNPEYVSQCLAARGLRVMALVEPLEPPQLATLFQRYRASHGNQFVQVGLSGMKQALRHLRNGGVIAVLVDRDLQHTGVSVPFFGAPARLPAGAIDLALHTGAEIIPVITRRAGFDRFHVVIEPPLPVERTGDPRADRRINTARLIQRFEPYIRRDPSQWFVIDEPVWPCAGTAPAEPAAVVKVGTRTVASNGQGKIPAAGSALISADTRSTSQHRPARRS